MFTVLRMYYNGKFHPSRRTTYCSVVACRAILLYITINASHVPPLAVTGAGAGDGLLYTVEVISGSATRTARMYENKRRKIAISKPLA